MTPKSQNYLNPRMGAQKLGFGFRRFTQREAVQYKGCARKMKRESPAGRASPLDHGDESNSYSRKIYTVKS
jgi:hypothetical protein